MIEQGVELKAESTAGAQAAREKPVLRSPSSRALSDLFALRTVLSGRSVVDDGGIFFPCREAVVDFLRLSCFDTDNPLEVARIRELHDDAVTFLIDSLGFSVPIEVQEPGDVYDIFLMASRGDVTIRRAACLALKVMHIQHHLATRRLVFNTPMSEADLFNRLNAKVMSRVDEMRSHGIGLVEFSSGKKSATSMTAKLLAKRAALATQIFDKMRFRLVTETRKDLVSALVYLLRHLVPFNYTVPGQSQNGIIGIDDIAAALDLSPAVILRHWSECGADAAVDGGLAGDVGVAPTSDAAATGVWDLQPTPLNEFSGRSFHSVNFVCEIPMRIDDVMTHATPAIAFAQTEIQLVDRQTHEANNSGDNAHELYKSRQLDRVRARLEGVDSD